MIKRIVKLAIIKAKFLFNGGSSLSIFRAANIGLNSKFEGYNKVGRDSSFHGVIGYCSYIGEHAKIVGIIGRFTSIADGVLVITGTHPYSYPFVSTCPSFYSTNRQNNFVATERTKFKEYITDSYYHGANIGNDCWICTNAIILAGITVGDGAVILPGAVVTKDVKPYEVVGGVPARTIKTRYRNDDIVFLLKFKWWERDLKWIDENKDLMCNIENLRKKFD